MMNLKRKKFLLPTLTLALVFILSACSLDKNKEPESELEINNSNLGNDNLLDAEELQISKDDFTAMLSSIEANNTSELEEVNLINLSEETSREEVSQKKDMIIDPNNYEDLVGVYSKAKIKTNLGTIEVKFYNSESPKTVNNFMNLAQAGFYNGVKFH